MIMANTPNLMAGLEICQGLTPEALATTNSLSEFNLLRAYKTAMKTAKGMIIAIS